ncbi:hypothetical protein JCM1840_006856 [Sporobolomyces johnsonii]
MWVDNPDDLPSRQLKIKLDRLEALVTALRARPIPPPSPTPSPITFEQPTTLFFPEVEPSPLAVPSPSLARARDTLCRALFVNADLRRVELAGEDTMLLEAKLRRIDEEDRRATHCSPSYLTSALPTPAQAYFAVSVYFAVVNSSFRLVHAPSFVRDCHEFWSNCTIPSQTWIATYFAVCAAGLRAALEDEITLRQSGLKTEELSLLAGRCWDESRRVLESEGFPLQATLEGVRACAVLVFAGLHGDAQSLAKAAALSSLAASAAYDLELHRDPYELAPNLSPLEAEMRRRVFWALYTFEAITVSLLGNPGFAFDDSDVSARHPLYLPDETYLSLGFPALKGMGTASGASGAPSSTAIFSVASASRRIFALSKSTKAPGRDDIAKLLVELDALGSSVDSNPLAAALFHFSCMRMHALAVELGVADTARGESAVDHLDPLINIASSTAFASVSPSERLLVLALAAAAAVSEAFDSHTFGNAFADSSQRRRNLRTFVSTLGISLWPASLQRTVARCIAVMLHLLGEGPKPFLEPSPSLACSSLATPSDVTLPSPASVAPLSATGASHCSMQLPFVNEDHVFPPLFPPSVFQIPAVPAPLPATHTVPLTRPLPPHTLALPARPLLSLHTSVGPGANKSSTPILSPWHDPSQSMTPSRYVGHYAWESSTLF